MRFQRAQWIDQVLRTARSASSQRRIEFVVPADRDDISQWRRERVSAIRFRLRRVGRADAFVIRSMIHKPTRRVFLWATRPEKR